MTFGDTIAAISSAVGPAARMIVRLSGPKSRQIAAELCDLANDRAAFRTHLRFNALSVPAWLYQFHAPRSYTGEDIIEFHLPGNPLLVRMLLDELIQRGARSAEPGEFTARAYFSGRIDLTEAEGVAAAIAAHGEDELAAARQLLAGQLARRLRPIMDQLAEMLSLVEAGIDFSEDDVTFIATDEVTRRVNAIDNALTQLLAESARFEQLTHEAEFVLLGRPNAGKSTLLNALARTHRAIVSPIEGTTRDVISAHVSLNRGVVRVTDLAGLDEQTPDPPDSSPQSEINQKMRAHALATAESADFVLLVQDAADPRPRLTPTRPPCLTVLTKIDLLPAEPTTGPNEIAISAQTGKNLAALRQQLDELAFGHTTPAASKIALNARHLQAISETQEALHRATQAAEHAGPEVIALELRESLDGLGSILGQVTPDDVLGRVFATFCIGK
jgi:tRNA modification GTPase